MKLPLSDRLLACAGFVNPGDRVADIGCDHGYLGIYLLQQKIASHVIASDVVPGPLQAARRNAEKYGFSEHMTFVLSDGVASVPRDFDTLVCAGMGADTMTGILSAAPWLQSAQYRLILQCQSKTPTLRGYLSHSGWHIAKEAVLRDGRFLYTVMEVLWEPDTHPPLTEAECYLSPALLQTPSPELSAYCNRVVDGLRTAAVHKKELQPLLDQLAAIAQEVSV